MSDPSQERRAEQGHSGRRTAAVIALLGGLWLLGRWFPGVEQRGMWYDVLFVALAAAAAWLMNGRALSQLRQALQRYRSLYDYNVDSIFIIDLKGRIVEFNPAGRKRNMGDSVTGYTPDELIRDNSLLRFPPEQATQCREYFKQAVQGREQAFETRAWHKDGHLVDISLYFIPMRENGEITGVYGIATDISNRKNERRQLIESEQRYKSLFENNPDAVYSIDLRGKFVSGNPACAKITGYSVDEWSKFSIRAMLSPENFERSYEHFQKATQGIPQKFDLPLLRKDGMTIRLTVTLIPIIVDEKVTGVYGIAKDITEREKTEELLRKSDKLSVVGELAAGVAHEIRNPLTAIKGFVQLLQFGGSNKAHYYEIMMSELDRIEFIINEFLVLAKPQAVRFQKKDICTLLHSIAALLDTQAILNNVVISMDYEEDIPLIECEENRLKQVFVNVMKNAIEAMPAGGELLIEVKQTPDEQVLLRFTDTGCGIPESRIPKLGEPFYTTKEKGTGLGLMVSYKIIEEHEGTIGVHSILAVGTVVEILLPVAIRERI